MTNKSSPIFTLHEPHHFNDYGFDPQLDYFQVLQEARKHKHESSSFRFAIDNLHFKLQKPFSKDDNSKKIKKTRKRWWKNALHFFKRKRTSSTDRVYSGPGARTLSGPLYLTKSRTGSSTSTPYHRTPSSRPLSGHVNIPYINLNEHQTHTSSAPRMPIYLVT
ncbi:uncharacterized protein LOC143596621 [Bidens hawaiensis]|uniref:uncharacterized protein LOC143596621 n=1 Tax=Bidens hawaiensis TaxID=980011 RepID=UPI00404AC0DF